MYYNLFKRLMRRRRVWLLLPVAVAFALAIATQAADPKSAGASEEDAIRDAVAQYVAAFNQGDAKALAALWSPEAVYINPVTGQKALGRAEIEEQFAAVFAAGKGCKLEAQTNSIRFVSPNVAVEEGVAKVLRPNESPEESEYTAVYVKRDGRWLLDRVTEEDEPVVTSHFEQLKELEWMVGTWVDQDDQARVETTCQWTKNRNFMTRSFMVSVRHRIDMAGMQIIGWDPATKKIRSWVFDSDGTFGEGVWTKKGNSWYIQTTGTLPDGQKSSTTNILTYVDDNTFTWQSINRVSGGEMLPNIDEIVITRQPEAE